MKRALEVGADDLVLVQDPAFDTWDSRQVATALAAAIRALGGAELVLCGRQASDWDNALVPLLLAEELGLPCLTLARRLSVTGGEVEVERVLADGAQVMRASLPALVTVTSELGPLRFPTVPARLAAARRQPRLLGSAELDLPAVAAPPLVVSDLEVPVTGRVCELVVADSGAAAGVRLAETLLEAGLVRVGGEG
jgi:electron transfer flavoprotein beta subunit